jgi:CheY-like chemotaxis protein
MRGMMTEIHHILLAEDNAHDAELTITALRDNRLANDVVVVTDGAQVLDYLYRRNGYAQRATGDPSLILLDLKMPKVDGVEVLRQVKSDPALRTIPVIMLTSSREEHDVVRSYDLGVNAYVVKPVDFTEFIDAVKLLGGFWAVVNEPPPRPGPMANKP